MSRSGKVKLRVACPKSESACTGRLTLRTKRGSAVSRSFALKGGTSERVTLRLGQAGKRAVKRHGMLRATALTVATDAAGNVGSSQATVTIRR
jgi:hypothetical protein